MRTEALPIRAVAACVLACALVAGTGCATAPRATPTAAAAPALALRLAPSTLGRALALQQQLTVTRGDEVHTLDALLEADATELRLVVQAANRPALRLRWDGATLEQTRASWLPPALSGERVLTDLQLAYWPVDAVAAALPAGWTLDEPAGQRVLREGGAVVATVAYPSSQRIEIAHVRDGFRLAIDSVPLEPAP